MDFMVFLKISEWKMSTNEEKHHSKRSGRDVFVAQAICPGIPLGMALLLHYQKITWCPTNTGPPMFFFYPPFSLKKTKLAVKERKLGRCCAVGTFQGNILIFRFPAPFFDPNLPMAPRKWGKFLGLPLLPNLLGRICLRRWKFLQSWPIRKNPISFKGVENGSGIFRRYGWLVCFPRPFSWMAGFCFSSNRQPAQL